MNTITAICRAKVNLTLDILDKRDDGFHNLQSVMQSIDLNDKLTVTVGEGQGIRLTVNDPRIPTDDRNTVYKACQLFVEALDTSESVSVAVEKRIPVQAGLGGGSTDAAGTLLALNTLFDSPLSASELACLAAEVGSDVPFFLIGGTALVSGKGNVVQKLPDVYRMDIVVVKPDVGISTPWAYRRLSESERRISAAPTAAVVAALRRGDNGGVIRSISNDFQRIVAEEFSEIAQAKRDLREAGAVRTLLSGSGAAVFGVFEDNHQAQMAAATLADNYPYSEVTTTTENAIRLMK